MQINLTAQAGKYTNKPAHTGRQIWKWISLVGVLVFFITNIVSPGLIRGDEVDELENDLQNTRNQIQQYENQLNNTKAQIEEAKKKAASYAGALQSYSGQLAYAQAQLEQTQLELEQKKLELENTEAKVQETTLSVQYHERALRGVVRDFYKRSFGGNISFWLSNDTIGDVARTATYRARVSEGFQYELMEIVGMLDQLLKQKDQLAVDKENFEKQQQELTDRQTYLRNQISTANTNLTQSQGQQQRLTSDLAAIQDKLAQLNARQQEILAARSGGFAINAENQGADDYYASLLGFNEQAPSGYFAVFSIGAFTHRNGMSQYGALGRANQGQNAEQLLGFYYPGKELKKDYPEPATIHVRGQGTSCFVQPDNTYNKYYDEVVDFQTYLRRIYEVPGSWPQSVLRAQAVAARTYALRIGSPIQPNQGHQVYKDCDKGGAWTEAVDATKGWVLLQNGSPAFTEYSSTTGGWINNVGWDTTDGKGGINLINNAYEKIAGSPWVYKAWYTQSYSSNSGKCGRTNPWLSPIEMADIINAAFVLYGSGSGADVGRIVPVTTSCWPGNPYSHDELREVSKHYQISGSGSGGIKYVSGVSIVQGGNGTTSEVIFQTDAGVKRLSGTQFKAIFNTRAPGYLGIQQSGFSFFNIEHK